MDSDMQSFMLPMGGFEYRGTNLDDLESDSYTLATLASDLSGSTLSFRDIMEHITKEVVKGLRNGPAKDNLLYRQVHFESNITEFHGYKQLHKCNESDYDGCYDRISGATRLYDAEVNVIEATTAEADRLHGQQYMSNGIIIVMTDGADYTSKLKEPDVKTSLANAIASEKLDSLISLLIGVNITSDSMKQKLERHKDEVGFTRFDWVDNLNEEAIGKLVGFISKSVVAQSQSVGKGPSQQIKSLTF